MALLDTLLTAIVRADGDALVMHAGDRPYVVTRTGTVELSSQVLRLDAVSGMLTQLLPADVVRQLEEFGAIEHRLPDVPAGMGDRYTVVAARGNDDIWIEVRRLRRPAAPVDSGWAAPGPAAPRPAAGAPPASRDPIPSPSTPSPEAAVAAPAPETSEDAGPEPVKMAVVPMTRTLRIEVPTRTIATRPATVERLLRIAAARGASALHLVSKARPCLRVDGDIAVLDAEPVLTGSEIESLVLDLLPERSREAFRRGEPAEWVSDLPEIGRVRCLTFRDHRGPGALFQMVSARPASADQLGLTHEIQALAAETEGLVLIAAPRANGKSTVLAALIDAINGRRSEHVIVLERQTRLVHENRQSLVSQREMPEAPGGAIALARAALRENPDVLVLDDLRTADLIQLALDAAGSGLLVLASITASSATAAIARLVDLLPPDLRLAVLAALAERLRGVVAQVLLRKTGGGRLAARELLLNTATVSGLLADDQITRLPLAIEGGRKHGMVPLNDALVAFVKSGAVDVREAYRKADNREALLAQLKRHGVDTSFAERLA